MSDYDPSSFQEQMIRTNSQHSRLFGALGKFNKGSVQPQQLSTGPRSDRIRGPAAEDPTEPPRSSRAVAPGGRFPKADTT